MSSQKPTSKKDVIAMSKAKKQSPTSKTSTTSREKINIRKLVDSYIPKFVPKKRFLPPKLVIIILSLLVTSVLVFFAILFRDVPSPTRLTREPAAVSTQILDRNGELLYEIFTDENRTPIDIETLPDHVLQATIAIEDQNFYQHFGLDFGGILRAAYKTLTGQRLEGGSTLTQQLVKTALLDDPSRTVTRKIKEAALAIITEVIYSKDQILEMYLNHTPYGGTAYGIETASRQYFGKSSSELTLAEASLLAGLPQAPSRYSPFGSRPELGKERQLQVLRRMTEDGYITKEQADEAAATELVYAESGTTIKAPHFVLWVRDLLTDKYGDDMVNNGGLRVTTSLDLELQDAAQASLSAEVDSLARLRVGNGAAVVTKPKTGEVLSMIGSRDYFNTEEDGNVNVTLRYRQPGSSIKPLNYALGIYKGWGASTTYVDVPTCFGVTGQAAYCPVNYDNTWHGPVPMRQALANSYNIPAVKQMALNGIEDMIATSSAMGITGWNNPDNYGLSLTLGGGEVRMVDMAVAFGVFANEGVRVPLHPILKVETYKGEILEELDLTELENIAESAPLDWDSFQEKIANGGTEEKETPRTTDLGIDSPYRAIIDRLTGKDDDQETDEEEPETLETVQTVLPQEVTYIISDILSDNSARAAAFGTNSQLVIPRHTVAVKTGTTNDLRDNWTIGYTPDYLVATWVGNNDNSPMSYVASGVTGASPIFNDIMRFTLRNEEVDHQFTRPDGVVDATVCRLTGLLATQEGQCEGYPELFIKGQLPLPTYATRKQIWIRRDNKLPLMPGDDVIDLDLEEHTIVSDPFVAEFCLDCAYPQETKPNPDNPEEQLPTGKISYPTINVNYDLFKLKNITPTNWLSQLTSPGPDTP